MGTWTWSVTAARTALAAAYHDTAAAGADMRAAADLLEDLRDIISRPSAVHRTFDAVDGIVGEAADLQSTDLDASRADPGPVLTVLQRLRDDLVAAYLDACDEQLASLTGEQQADAWLEAMSSSLASFQFVVADGLAARAPHGGAQRALIDEVVASVPLSLEERWDEVRATYGRLATHPAVPPPVRVRLWAILADIELYVLSDPDAATAALDRGQVLLDPATDRTAATALLVSRARVERERGDLGRATHHATAALDLAPDDGAARTLLGDLARAAKDPVAALSHYEDARRRAPGDLTAIYALLLFHAAEDPPGLADDRIERLVAHGTAISPASAWSLHVAAGRAWRDAADLDRATAWFDRAVQGWPERGHGFSGRGFLRLGVGELAMATSDFQTSLELAPTLFEGWWGRGFAAETAEDWDGAYRAYLAGADRVATRAAWLRARVGLAPARAGDREAGEALFLQAAAMAATDPTLRSYAEEFAAFLAEDLDDPEAPLRFVEQVAGLAEDERSGWANIALAWLAEARGDLETAERQLVQAVELEPTAARAHTGLLRVLRARGRIADALAAVSVAPAVVAADEDFRQLASLVENDRGNELFAAGRFGAAAGHYREATRWDAEKPVLFANLAGALEADDELPAHQRLRATRDAVAAAHRLPGGAAYSVQLERLDDLLGLSATVDEHALRQVPMVAPIVLEVGADLVPAVATTDYQLRPELLERIDALRDELRDSLGLLLPAVTVRAEESLLSRGWRVSFWERPEQVGAIDDDRPDAPAALVAVLRSALLRAPGALVTAQMVATLIEEAEAAAATVREPITFEQLAYLTGVVRGLAGEGIPVVDILQVRDIARDHQLAGEDRLLAMEAARRVLVPGIDDEAGARPVTDAIVDAIAEGIVWDGSHPTLALPLTTCQEVLAELTTLAGGAGGSVAVTIDDPVARHFLQRLATLEPAADTLRVLTSEVGRPDAPPGRRVATVLTATAPRAAHERR
jgi:tetratricopeptide (TPR) repeat protein